MQNADPEVTRLAELVSLEPSKTVEDIVNLGVEAEVTRTIITLRDGTVREIESIPYPPITDPPADRERVEEVFMGRVSACWNAARAAELRDQIYRLDELVNVGDLTAKLI